MTIEFLDPNLQKKGSRDRYGDDAKQRVAYVDIDLCNFQDDLWEGESRVVFMAKDSRRKDYRDHQNKEMLAVNKAPVHKVFHIEDDWMHLLYPSKVARQKTLRDAFWSAGWFALTTHNSPQTVSDAATTEIDGYAPELSPPAEYVVSNGSFFYRKESDPTYCQRYRYVHAVYASRSEGDITVGNTVRFVNNNPARYSFIYVNRVKDINGGTVGDAANTTRVTKVTIHEIGHQFKLGDDHIRPREQAFIDSHNYKGLKNYRIATVKNPTNLNQFKRCVMNGLPNADMAQFCIFHANQIRGYDWSDTE